MFFRKKNTHVVNEEVCTINFKKGEDVEYSSFKSGAFSYDGIVFVKLFGRSSTLGGDETCSFSQYLTDKNGGTKLDPKEVGKKIVTRLY